MADGGVTQRLGRSPPVFAVASAVPPRRVPANIRRLITGGVRQLSAFHPKRTLTLTDLARTMLL